MNTVEEEKKEMMMKADGDPPRPGPPMAHGLTRGEPSGVARGMIDGPATEDARAGRSAPCPSSASQRLVEEERG